MVGPINGNEDLYVKRFAEETFNNKSEEKSKEKFEPIDFSDRGDYKLPRGKSSDFYKTMRYPSDDGGEIKENPDDFAKTMRYPSDDGGEVIEGPEKPGFKTMRYPSDDGGELIGGKINNPDLPVGWEQSKDGTITTDDGRIVKPVNVGDLPEGIEIKDDRIYDSEGNEIGRAATSQIDVDGDGVADEVTSYYLYIDSDKPDFGAVTMRYPSDDGGEIGEIEKPGIKTMLYPSDDGAEIINGIEKPGIKTMLYPSDDGAEIINGIEKPGIKTLMAPSDDGGEIINGKIELPEYQTRTLLYPSDDGGEIFKRRFR